MPIIEEMTWLKPPAPPAPHANQRQSFRLALETPIVLRLFSIQKPVHGLLVDISASGCRFRSLTLLERGQVIAFDWKRSGHSTIELRGKIISRRKQASLEYGVEFERLLSSEVEALQCELMELQRRAAAARSEAAGDNPHPTKQRRRTFRTVVTVNVTYKRDQLPGNHRGRASDLSIGGLRLTCDEILLSDELLTLTFTLPNEILGSFPDYVDEIDISPFGPRIVKKPHPLRPFEEIRLRAKVVQRFADVRGRVVVGLQFVQINGFDREQIARYIHAAQLYKLRR